MVISGVWISLWSCKLIHTHTHTAQSEIELMERTVGIAWVTQYYTVGVPTVVNFPSDFKEEWNSQLSNANLSSSCRPGVAGGFIIASHGHDWVIYNSYKQPYKRKLEEWLSERPVLLTTEQFQTVNLERRINKVFEQKFKVVFIMGVLPGLDDIGQCPRQATHLNSTA